MFRDSYGEEQIRSLVEEYEALQERKDTAPGRLRILFQLADLDRALERLPMKYWEVVLLHGLLGVPQRVAAQLLRVSQQAVSKRYRRGICDLYYLMNGGE